jgi:energy-converting hydrogenase Eha subunit E
MTWERLRMLGYGLALLLLGVVVFSLYGAFRTELEKSQFIGFLGGVALGTIMVSLIMVILIVPERRRTAWVQAITTVNAKYLFLALIIGWALSMGLLASLNLEVNTVGVPALIGLFAGIFIFMGFIWSVIGE